MANVTEPDIPGIDSPCPIDRAVQTIGDRWMLRILRHATYGVTRYDDFRTQLGIADNILSNRLGRLVASGLLVKVAYRDERRTRHEYRLTPAGADVLPVLHALASFGQQHTRPTEPAKPMRVIHSPCGHDIPRGEFCSHCDRFASRDEILWLPLWRSESPRPLAEPVA